MLSNGMRNVFLLLVIASGFTFSGITNASEATSRLSYDLGLSAGSVGNQNYTEVNLGLNYFFKEWLNWRNSIFSRFVTDDDDLYGFDTSLRAYWVNNFGERNRITLFAAPGLRLPSEGNATVFAEAGINLKLAGLSLGVGAKTFFNKLNNSDSDNDTLYFLVLAGSGNL